MIMTKENVHEIMEIALFARVKLENYNQDCFGMSDLRYAMASGMLLEHIYEGIEKSGVSPVAVVGEISSKFGIDIVDDAGGLAEELPDDFECDLVSYDRILSVGEHVKRTTDDFEGFLASNKYR